MFAKRCPPYLGGMTESTQISRTVWAIEVMLIGYLFVTSLVGLYTIPFIRMIRPKLGDTSLTHLILNCGLFLILSSALPLLSKILGQFSSKHSPIQLLARMRKC